MGQAKRRGTFEERKAQSIERQKVEAEQRKAELDRLKEEWEKNPSRNPPLKRKGLSPVATSLLSIGYAFSHEYKLGEYARHMQE